MQVDFKIITAAGMNKTDVARLFGVSRQTVYNWKGGFNVHPLIEAKVAKVVSAISNAVSEGALPVELDRDVDQRAKKIKNIVASYL